MSASRTGHRALRGLKRLKLGDGSVASEASSRAAHTLASGSGPLAVNSAEQAHEYQESSSNGLVRWACAAGGLLAFNWSLNGGLANQAYCEPLHKDPQGDAREGLNRVWMEVAADIEKRDAQLPSLRRSQRPSRPNIFATGDTSLITFKLRDGADLERVMAEISARLSSPKSTSRWNIAQRSVVIQSREGLYAKTTTFSSPAWPHLEIAVTVYKAEDKQPSIEIKKSKLLEPADWMLVAAAVKAANELPLSGEQQQLPGGLPSDLGPNTQVWSRSWSSASDAGRDLGTEVDNLWGSFSQDIQEMHKAVQRLLSFPGSDEDPFFGSQQPSRSSEPDMDVPKVRWVIPRPSASAPDTEQQQLPQQPQQDLTGDWGDEQQLAKPDPAAAAMKKLESLGAIVYPPKDKAEFDWDVLAGYEEQKQEIEDTLLLALQHPEVYEAIAAGTRRRPGSNRPRAVLFEGPPGCGKTTSARVIASQASVPLVYIPLEAIVSKWYGQSEKKLADMFTAADALPGCLVFLDEIDSLATTRGGDMHEATRRLLGVLLRQLDGMQEQSKTVTIGATNRKQDLDPALLSRFDSSIAFGLPSDSCRHQILKQFAKHLGDQSIAAIVRITAGMSGRDLRDLCEGAERRWASKIIRNKAGKGELPPEAEYLASAHQRSREKRIHPDSNVPFV
ncbi:hypothetical protein WJX74_004214 [Apatococcus lobatus]|uniref:AAA+ ATPase domain-containing protein n=2 Tax=Apatococcus TaxID=904362 RepID=A0AAW1SUY8_9CHLO